LKNYGFLIKPYVAVAIAVSEPVTVAVLVAVAVVEPVAITLEIFSRVGNDYHCYQMEPLPANAIKGMYLHMFNG
jgi:hypothetical protein